MKAIIILSLLLSATAFGECVKTSIKKENINFQIIPSSFGKECFFMISPYNVEEMTYRGFTFATDGDFSIFTSYGQGPNSTTTGSSEMYFFPREHQIEFYFNDSLQRLEIKHVNGDHFYFDYATAEFTGSERGNFKIQKTIAKGDRGGIELVSYDGLTMDSGFMMGGTPTGDGRFLSRIKDREGNLCKIRNKSVFNYSDEHPITFKFSDEEFKAFLSEDCPALRW
ncbi:MAG: hypothetical protein RJB66_1656 [Pseudomonadota bacterium]|jgi:hypothetical protein